MSVIEQPAGGVPFGALSRHGRLWLIERSRGRLAGHTGAWLPRVWLLALVLLGGTQRPPVAAQERPLEPMLVISFAGWDRLHADLKHLGSVSQNSGIPQAVGRVLTRLTSVQDLPGLDRSRPCGASLSTDGLLVAPVAFLPVSQPREFLAAAAPALKRVEPLAENRWKIGEGSLTGFALHQGDWLYVAQTEEGLRHLPDPAATLGRLPQEFDLAVQLWPARIPEALRTMALDQLRQELRQSLPPPEAQQPADQVRRRTAQRWYQACERLLADCQQVTLGWTLDEASGQLRLDLVNTPQPGSPLAESLARLRRGPSLLGNLSGRDTALVVQSRIGLSTEQSTAFAADAAALGQLLEQRLQAGEGGGKNPPAGAEPAQPNSAVDRRAVAELSRRGVELARGLIATGQVEAALAVQGAAPPFTLVAALPLDVKQDADTWLMRLAELARHDAALPRIERDVARIGEVPVHRLEPVSWQGNAELERLLGRDLRFWLAASSQQVVVAVGPQAQAALERAFQPKAELVPPLEVQLRPAAALDAWNLLSADSGQRGLLTLLAGNLRSTNDPLKLTLEATDTSLRARLEAGPGVSRLMALGLSLGAIQLLSQPATPR